MSNRRLLLAGPHSSDPTAEALRLSLEKGSGVWIVPRSACKPRLIDAFSSHASNYLVLTWDELWREAARDSAELPPLLVSDAARRPLIDLAVQATRDLGLLKTIDAVVDRPGYRRLLAHRFRHGLPPSDDRAGAEERAIHESYLALLERIGRVDPPRYREWAAASWLASSRVWDDRFAHVTIQLDGPPTGPKRRFIEHLAAEVGSVVLVAPGADDDSIRNWCVRNQIEFREVAGGSNLESEVGREDDTPVPTDGLRILGGPGAEGQARLIAAELRARPIDGRAVLLVTAWTDATREIVDRLRAFGESIQPPPPLALRTNPRVVRLFETCRLPEEGWPIATLAAILGTGGLGLDWIEFAENVDLTRVAADLRGLGLFRGIDAALERLSGDPRRVETVRVLTDFRRLIDSSTTGATRHDHFGGLTKLATSLGLTDDPDWDLLALALEEILETFDQLQLNETPLSWGGFVEELETVAEESRRDERDGPYRIETFTVDEFAGARAERVILVDLTEGSFPAESALTGTPERKQAAHAEELARFKQVVGSADRSLILAYPTVDESGEDLLPAGFLDGILRRLPKGSSDVHVKYKRFDPTFAGQDELALTDNDRRVLAMARAVATDGSNRDDLTKLARRPEHAAALAGTAAALRLGHQRFGEPEFGRFDGLLLDPSIISRVATDFGPNAVFSASQIESYLWCPFQFYLKYVLRLKPNREAGELEPDLTRFGSRLHDRLEQIHVSTAEGAEAPTPDQLRVAIETRMAVELTTPGDEVGQALIALEEANLDNVLRKYLDDYTNYLANDSGGLIPSRFEIGFGPTRKKSGTDEVLEIGTGDHRVRLQGLIDRVDMLETEEGLRFRIIDYKTFSVPSNTDVVKGLYVQLPLYALAVQRLRLLGNREHSLEDFGYWGLSRDGFVKVKLPRGEGSLHSVIERIERTVIEAIDRLRGGDFSITPRKDDCRRGCEFASVCRVQEVRNAGKPAPDLSIAEARKPEVEARG